MRQQYSGVQAGPKSTLSSYGMRQSLLLAVLMQTAARNFK